MAFCLKRKRKFDEKQEARKNNDALECECTKAHVVCVCVTKIRFIHLDAKFIKFKRSRTGDGAM